jgi:Mg-chelatase subunit ChlD
MKLEIPTGQRKKEKNKVEVVFCIDFSASMSKIISGVREHIQEFIAGLKSANSTVDHVRIGLVMNANRLGGKANAPIQQLSLTEDTKVFVSALEKYKTAGNEMPIPALDVSVELLDRESQTEHKVIIIFTNEAISGHDRPDYVRSKLDLLQTKINERNIMVIFIIPAKDDDMRDFANGLNKQEQFDIQDISTSFRWDLSSFMNYIGKSITIHTVPPGQSRYSVTGPLYPDYPYDVYVSDI